MPLRFMIHGNHIKFQFKHEPRQRRLFDTLVIDNAHLGLLSPLIKDVDAFASKPQFTHTGKQGQTIGGIIDLRGMAWAFNRQERLVQLFVVHDSESDADSMISRNGSALSSLGTKTAGYTPLKVNDAHMLFNPSKLRRYYLDLDKENTSEVIANPDDAIECIVRRKLTIDDFKPKPAPAARGVLI
jgi:hypothetical protein